MNVADQKALQEQPNNIIKVDSLERPWNAVTKDYSAPSKADYENPNNFLSSHLHLLSACLYR